MVVGKSTTEGSFDKFGVVVRVYTFDGSDPTVVGHTGFDRGEESLTKSLPSS